MEIEQLRDHARDFGLSFSKHANYMIAERNITKDEVLDIILSGEIIEEYSEQRYGPCFLIYGRTTSKRHLHVACSLLSRVRIITIYEPDPDRWMEYRVRK